MVNWRASARRLLPYVIVAASGFLLAYLVVFVFVFPSSVVPDDGRVPNVVGLEYPDAQRRLAVAGYEAERGMRRYSATAAENAVLAQSPTAGTPLARGNRVTMDVSAGERSAEVPNVVGASEQQARALIETAGFEIGTVSQQAADAPRGSIVGATPPPGGRVALPARVDLVVSSGPPEVTVPRVVGRPIDEARQLLVRAGLQVSQVTVDPAAIDLPNTVTAQSVAEGDRVAGGTAVRLTVAGYSSGGAPPAGAAPAAPRPPAIQH